MSNENETLQRLEKKVDDLQQFSIKKTLLIIK